MIRLDRYEQLRRIAWHLPNGTTELTPAEAFALYERNWRHVDMQAMLATERELVAQLTQSVGRGVMLVSGPHPGQCVREGNTPITPPPPNKQSNV